MTSPRPAYAATGAGVISATCVQIQAPADRWEGGWVRVYLVRMAARGHPQETEPPLVESSLSLAGIAMAIAALFPELSLPLVVLAPLVAWSSVVAGLSSYAALRALGRSYRVLVQARQGQGATCGHRFCKHDTVLLLQHGRATSHWWVAVSILFFFSMVLLVDVMFIVSNYLDWAIEKGL